MSKLADIIAAAIAADPSIQEELIKELNGANKNSKKRGRPNKTQSKVETVGAEEAVEEKPVEIIDSTTFSAKNNKRAMKLSGLQLGVKPQFIDDQQLRKVNGVDLIKENQKIKKNRQAPDRRPPARKVSVVCHVCHRTEKIPPALVPTGYGKDDGSLYRCNNCR